MDSFLSELKRRNVLRVAAAYAVVAWILIEAGSVLMPTFGASEMAFQNYVIVVAGELKSGDRVAVRGAESLDDGELVAVQTET